MANPTYAFIEQQIALLGDQDPLPVLAATPQALRAIVSAHPGGALEQDAHRGKWRPVDIIGHLADSEWVFGYRTRMILCEAGPQLTPVDQDAWVAAQRTHRRAPEELVRAFTALRGEMLAFWRRLTPHELERGGDHTGAETRMTLAFIRRVQAGHDLSHLAQLRSYLDVIVGQQGGEHTTRAAK